MNPFVSSLSSVWKDPKHVFIEDEAIKALAARFSQEEMSIPSWRDPVFPAVDDDLFLSFISVGNSINFAFKDFTAKKPFSIEWRGQTWRGAFAMWACLMRALENGIEILSATFLERVQEEQLEEIFRGTSAMPMLGERCTIFNEIGRILRTKYDGSFSNLFKRANFAAFGKGGIVERLIEDFPSFRDESVHKASGRTLKFHKRAQLLVMMYQGRAFSSKDLHPVHDYEDLGPIADYAVPRALRTVGVLQYSEALGKMVKEQTLIEKDSLEEQEIRAQTTRAQAMLLESVNKLRTSRVTTLHLDYKVWTLGGTEPHHLTRTTAY